MTEQASPRPYGSPRWAAPTCMRMRRRSPLSQRVAATFRCAEQGSASGVALTGHSTSPLQRVARAYMPPGKGLRLPHFAMAFNVLIMPSGSILSLDDVLHGAAKVRLCEARLCILGTTLPPLPAPPLPQAPAGAASSKRCALPTLVSPEPPEITAVRRDTMNSFLLSMQVWRGRMAGLLLSMPPALPPCLRAPGSPLRRLP